MKYVGYMIFLVLVSAPTLCFSHHGTSTNRPAANADRAQNFNNDTSRVSLTYQMSYFGSTLDGDQRYSRSGLGAILHNRFSLDGTFLLKTGTFFEAAIPFGSIHVYPENGANRSLSGISDITLRAGQRFNTTFENDQGLSFAANGGISLATGAYNSDSLLSRTDISAGENGQIDVATFNMNTSLGSGTYNMLAGAEIGYRLNKHFGTVFVQSLSIPLTRTSDDILWGLDSTSTLRTRWDVVAQRFALSASLNYQLHTVDEVEDIEIAGQYNDVGGKDQFSIGLGAVITFSSFSCALGANLPIYQSVGGIQLVETVNAQLGCGFAL